jgi:hypothetical protein
MLCNGLIEKIPINRYVNLDLINPVILILKLKFLAKVKSIKFISLLRSLNELHSPKEFIRPTW